MYLETLHLIHKLSVIVPLSTLMHQEVTSMKKRSIVFSTCLILAVLFAGFLYYLRINAEESTSATELEEESRRRRV